MTVLQLLKGLALIGALGMTTACVSFQPIEPIKNPPLEFRNDTIVPVEFVHPMQVGFRCAERGAKFLAMPGINSKACASPDLVTMPNPCLTITGGWYAEMLCHELAHANGWSPSHEGGNWLPDSVVHGTPVPEYVAVDGEGHTVEALAKTEAAPEPAEEIETYEFNLEIAKTSGEPRLELASAPEFDLSEFVSPVFEFEIAGPDAHKLPSDDPSVADADLVADTDAVGDDSAGDKVAANAGWSALVGQGLSYLGRLL